MGDKEARYLKKYKVEGSKIMYMTRDGRKTVIHQENGRKVETFHAIKGILENYPDEMFEIINKGIVVAPKYVEKVDNNVYTMTDGATFKGRVRVTKEQKDNAYRYNEDIVTTDWNEYAILDNMPLAYCIIELVFDEKGRGIDFIFRYCNKHMEDIEGKTLDEMINKSFYEVFENGDKKWLVTYADVALNGNSHTIESFSPEIDARLRIYCYQPKPNFCACVLIKI